MKQRIALVLISFILLVGGIVLLKKGEKARDAGSVPPGKSVETFSWKLEDSEEFNLDGGRKTAVVLIAHYSDGTEEIKRIDTVDGGCSLQQGEHYEGDNSGAGKLQCYYAGFGEQYRIVQDENGQAIVERKIIEEGVPEVPPPAHDWETVAVFEQYANK